MKERKLETYIRIRMYKSQKEKWQKIAQDKNMSITDLVISSVEETLAKSEKREVFLFVEKQGNIFSKIESNINQFARIVNTEKTVSDSLLESFNKHIEVISALKTEQNQLMRRIINLLAEN